MTVEACADFEALRIKISSKPCVTLFYFHYYGNKAVVCYVVRRSAVKIYLKRNSNENDLFSGSKIVNRNLLKNYL
jgi:hypothetical protein